jgi:PAS domain S-box-containing protein
VDAVVVPIHTGQRSCAFSFKGYNTEKRDEPKTQEYATNLENLGRHLTDEIRRNENAYHEIYDSFGEALIAIDWELNVIHWNKAAERVTTVKASDAVGKKVYEVLPETLTVDIAPYFESLRESRPARFMMNTVSRETKKPSIFEISTYPSSQGIIIIIEDKTEEEENKRLSAIGATAGMVGHDIRNPLQAMLSDIYLLKEELASTPECRDKEEINESIESLEQNIAYINKIVADLQDYARPINPEYVTVSFSDVLQRIFENIKIPDTIKLSIHVSHLEKIKTDPLLLTAVNSQPG